MPADISQSSWTEIDAQNNQSAPLGWTPGTMLPTQVEPTAQAMMGAIKRWWNRQNPIYAATLTTTDTYTVTPQTPVTSFTSFELWRVRMPSANTTTSPTITWGPSAATIQKYSSGSLVNLAVGDIQAQYYEFFFNNTVMVMINPAATSNVTGPASSTSGDIASYADTTGKLLADSGIAKSTIVKNATSSTSQSIPVFTDTSGTVIGNGVVLGSGPSNVPQYNSSGTLIVTLAGSGVSAGTYTNATVVVGSDGRITSAATGGIASKTITFTRVLTAANGSVSYTGVGFKPSSIIFSWALNGGGNNGTGQSFVDSSKNGYANTNQSADAASGNYALILPRMGLASITNGQTAILASYDVDGFTLTYTAAGTSDTYTFTIIAICYR